MLVLARRAGFWALDLVRGGEIRRNYKDIKRRLTETDINTEQLQKLLNHAVQNTAFYADKDPSDINSFDIIDKNIIKGRWDDLHAQNYIGKPLHYMSTSGSTGTPFTMEWDMGKRKRQLADLIYLNEIVGQKLGQRYVYFRVWNDDNRKSKIELFLQNLLAINILHIDDTVLENIRQRLKRRPYINSCLAYASTYELLGRYIHSKGDTPDMFPMKTLVSGSEVLSMEMKDLLKKTFGCRIIDRYSNEENGFLAQTGDMSDMFNVNIASFMIEILKPDSDEPAEPGELGRIVITDLYSFAIPLIRYDTGDMAVLAEVKDGWATTLKTIQGRKLDVIYDTKGGRLTPHTLSVYMWKYKDLKQYQFIQEDEKRYVCKVNGAEGHYEDEEMISYLKTVFGEDADIKIEHVEGIPVLASGKFSKTVCKYRKKEQ